MSGDERRSGDVFRAVLLGTLLAVLLVLFDLARTSTNPLNLVQPGELGPSVAVFHADFPDAELLSSTGLDGQQFYAVARNPFDLDEAAEHLDRPRYRLQRPLLSWLAWVGQPSGGGTGLIWSLFAVNVMGVAVLAAATSAISSKFGGPAWLGALVGLYPGVWWSLRVSVADSLATALALASIALLLHHRTRWAVVTGVGAVLAKETAALVLVGWALGRWRDWPRWHVVAGAGLASAAWAAYLRVRLPGSESVGELAAPFVGFFDAVTNRWLEGDELWGLLGTATALGVAGAALVRRGRNHHLTTAIVVQLAFLVFANGDVIGNDFGAGRSMLPLLALSTIAFFTPTEPTYSRKEVVPASQGGAGGPDAGVWSGGDSNS